MDRATYATSPLAIKERQEAIAVIQAEINAARESGSSKPLDLDNYIVRKFAKHEG